MPNNAYTKPKKKKQTPLEPKSHKFLQQLGFIVGKTSWWQYTNFGFQTDDKARTFTPRSFSGVRQDLFGFVDKIAFKPTMCGTLYVQVTSITNASNRKNKAINSNTIDHRGRKRMILYELLNSGNHFHIHAWKKDEKSNRWKVRIDIARLDNGIVIWDRFWADMKKAKEGMFRMEGKSDGS